MMALKETVKELLEKALSIGTPPEKEVLYKEVVKRKPPKESAERLFWEDVKASVKKLFSVPEGMEFSRGTPNPPVIKATKRKSGSKKTATNKSTTKQSSTSTQKKSTTAAKTTSTKKKSTSSTTNKKSSTQKSTTVKKTTNTQKTTTKKTESTPKTPASKKTTTKKLSKREEKIALYIKDIKKHYGEVDEAFVAIVVKNLGPSIYRKDAELVSCSEPKELDTVRRNFLIKKLGLDASKSVLDAAIGDVCAELKGVRKKYRATFYYALAKKFKKESALS